MAVAIWTVYPAERREREAEALCVPAALQAVDGEQRTAPGGNKHAMNVCAPPRRRINSAWTDIRSLPFGHRCVAAMDKMSFEKTVLENTQSHEANLARLVF